MLESHRGILPSQLRRRSLLKLGGSALGLLGGSRLLASSDSTSISGGAPRFFIHVYVRGGWDQSYMFDPRPRSFTARGKIQNYRPANEELIDWPYTEYDWSRTGGSVGRSKKVAPAMGVLKPYRDLFSVVQGVVMSPSQDDHAINRNILVSGQNSGGAYYPFLFYPGMPLDGIRFGGDAYADAFLSNGASFANLSKKIISNLQSQGSLSTEQPRTMQLVRERIQANKSNGAFGRGVQLLDKALNASQEFGAKINDIEIPDDALSTMKQNTSIALSTFRSGITRVVDIELEYSLDCHSSQQAMQMPAKIQLIAQDLADMMEVLKSTEFKDGKSFLDVTTFVIASEFGRSMRGIAQEITNTGTEHNRYCNTYLIGGCGIKGGQLIGGSDLDKLQASGEFALVSQAHRRRDESLILAFGKPFHFDKGISYTDAELASYEFFDPNRQLTYANITNTLMSLFDVPSDKYWKVPLSDSYGKVLHGLLS